MAHFKNLFDVQIINAKDRRCLSISQTEVQHFERGSILGPSAEVQRSTELGSSMSDARFLKRDGGWSMHGKVPMVEGRRTLKLRCHTLKLNNGNKLCLLCRTTHSFATETTQRKSFEAKSFFVV